MRSWVTSRSLVFALLVTSVASLCGCDETDVVAPEDRRLALGALVSTVCPDETLNPPTAKTDFVATVFATDGAPAPDVPVTFTTSTAGVVFEASGNETTVVNTNTIGRALATIVVTGRPADDELTVSATPDNGLTATRTIDAPTTPFLSIVANTSTPSKNGTVSLLFIVTSACNVSKVKAGISFDPEIVEYVPAGPNEAPTYAKLVNFDDSDTSGTGPNQQTILTIDDSTPGRLGFVYEPDTKRGSNQNTTYFSVTLRTKSSGSARLLVESAELETTVGNNYDLKVGTDDSRVGISPVTVID